MPDSQRPSSAPQYSPVMLALASARDALIDAQSKDYPNQRAFALAKTKVEEAIMWCKYAETGMLA